MPVNTPHPDYVTQKLLWQKQRRFRDGGDAVKAANEDYLPRLSGDDDEDYRAYKNRALFYGATGRTLQALSGAIFRKDARVEFPRPELLKLAGKAGESVDELIKRCTEEQILPARVGTLVDAPAIANGRPYITIYFAENIINWATQQRGESEELVEVVLEEQLETRNKDDRFKVERKTQFRVLRLGNPQPRSDEEALKLGMADAGDKAVYYQELWVEQVLEEATANTPATITFTLKDIIVPRMYGGRTLEHIPFTIFNARSLAAKPEPGPMLELVNVNCSHYVSSADLEHGRHFTALPTPVLTGFNPDFRLRIGSGVAWITEQPAARAYFLEFSGAGLGHLVEGQKHKEHLMATLGARLLEEQKAGVEAADTLRIRQQGEQSALTNVVVTADHGWTRTLQFYADWYGLSTTTVACTINKDFDLAQLDPAQQQALMLQVQAGLMSYDTYFHNMKKGEVYPPDWTIEQERAAIEAGPPMAQPSSEADALALESSAVNLDTSKENLKQLKQGPAEGEAA